MSEGPIKRWRDAHLPKRSIPQSEALHLHDATTGRAACGRRPQAGKVRYVTDQVTCGDCIAAIAADRENGHPGR